MDGGDSSRMTLQQRLDELSKVEEKIEEILKSAQSCMAELGKDKQTSKQKIDEAATSFRDSVNYVDGTLSAQLAYLRNVCVGTPHQGSTFASHQRSRPSHQLKLSNREYLIVCYKSLAGAEVRSGIALGQSQSSVEAKLCSQNQQMMALAEQCEQTLHSELAGLNRQFFPKDDDLTQG